MSRSDDTSATGVAIAKSIRTNFAPVECSSVRVAAASICLAHPRRVRTLSARDSEQGYLGVDVLLLGDVVTAVDRQLGYRAIVAWWSPPTCGVTTIRPIDEGVTAR